MASARGLWGQKTQDGDEVIRLRQQLVEREIALDKRAQLLDERAAQIENLTAELAALKQELIDKLEKVAG